MAKNLLTRFLSKQKKNENFHITPQRSLHSTPLNSHSHSTHTLLLSARQSTTPRAKKAHRTLKKRYKARVVSFRFFFSYCFRLKLFLFSFLFLSLDVASVLRKNSWMIDVSRLRSLVVGSSILPAGKKVLLYIFGRFILSNSSYCCCCLYTHARSIYFCGLVKAR